MHKHIFSGDGEKYCPVVVITIMFLCFDDKVSFLTQETTKTMMFELKTDRTMTTYLGKYKVRTVVKPHACERHFAKVGKMVPYMCHFHRLYFM